MVLFSDLYKEKHATFEFNLFLHFNLERNILVWDSIQYVMCQHKDGKLRILFVANR